MCLFRIICTVLAIVEPKNSIVKFHSSTSFKIVPRLEHFSGYGPVIAIVRDMKLGVAKRRIGTNSFLITF